MNKRLPVTLKPFPGELLSSWISRHAGFYGVSKLTMLRHCLPEVSTLRAIDLTLNGNQAVRLEEIFSTDAKTVLQMSFGQTPNSAHRFLSKKPIQICRACSCGNRNPTPILRSQLQGWRITCPHCKQYFQDITQHDCVLGSYLSTALLGERLLDEEAENAVSTWSSRFELARLLLMRRKPRSPPREKDFWRFRILGVIVPELDIMLAKEMACNFSRKHPILPLHIRPALLAGIAIVERAGPEMLMMLRHHTVGENRNRFIQATEHLIPPDFGSAYPHQMYLI